MTNKFNWKSKKGIGFGENICKWLTGDRWLIRGSGSNKGYKWNILEENVIYRHEMMPNLLDLQRNSNWSVFYPMINATQWWDIFGLKKEWWGTTQLRGT